MNPRKAKLLEMLDNTARVHDAAWDRIPPTNPDEPGQDHATQR